jgi:glycosyltransferase involved in cell wall biosynthesis
VSKCLLICPEPLGHGRPAGVGIRFIEFARGLTRDGHAVTLLSPDGGAPDDTSGDILTPATIARESSRCEVVIVQGHAANDYFAHGTEKPTVIDLYDPFVVENFHYFPTQGPGVYAGDHAALTRSIARGDFFLCASAAQRLFFLGFMLAAGRLNPESFADDESLQSLLAIVPFGVQLPRPQPTRRERAPRAGRNLLFGGIYDWYDPILAIEAARLAARQLPGLTVTFTEHPNPETTPQGSAAAARARSLMADVKDIVRFEPWFRYENRGDFFDRFDAALLTFGQSLETDLSMRTRIFDYLWGGLPVITSSAPGTDAILGRYHAGVVVRSDDPEMFAEAVVSLLGDPVEQERLHEGARRFTADHQWDTLMEPLLRFCRNPRREPTRDRYARDVSAPPQRVSPFERLRKRIGARR